MRFSFALIVVVAVVVLHHTPASYAVTEPVCSYRNSQDDTVFLKYLPLAHKGEEYVDFGTDGKCVKRASCSDTFKTVVEDCNKFPVTCSNKKRYEGVFPACCVKC